MGAEIEEEGDDDDEPLESPHFVRRAPHHRVGQGRPGQQEEADEGHEPAVESAAEQVAEDPDREQRQPRREQREEEDEAADGLTLSPL